ncbi:MAG: CPBP family intramembrane metalloprotease [Verrucomicrobia bacterium]|nr:CPBP family intramembrane metalloprotease [Verrucomicrobiota bacterium]
MTGILLILWAFAANWLAYTKGFYQLPKQQGKDRAVVTGLQLLGVFILYLLLTYVISRFILLAIQTMLKNQNPSITTLPISAITGLQFGVMLILFYILQWFMFGRDQISYRKIWKDRTHTPSSSIWLDLWIGGITWLMSFPLVSILIDLLDVVMKQLFQLEDYEQNAVKFVKVAMNTPLSLTFALLSVLIMAPLLEEFIFRGVVQTYLRRRIGPKAAILLSAFIFAIFHYSAGHSLGNVSLIFSLLILGTFLGFLYERQGSLWAPIGLHIAFNSVSAFRILFTPELT